MSTELVSPDTVRMTAYKAFSQAFAYPDENFFSVHPDLSDNKEALHREYDRLFRVCEIWLSGAEHIANNDYLQWHKSQVFKGNARNVP